MTGALVRRGDEDTERDTSNAHTQERPRENTERMWPSASQKERPKKEPTLPIP